MAKKTKKTGGKKAGSKKAGSKKASVASGGSAGRIIPQSEYKKRRERLSKQLKGSVGLVFAGDGGGALDALFEPNADFVYLTGVSDEPGACLVLDPGNPREAHREKLFLRPLNPEVEKWDGLREEIGSSLREKTGFRSVFRTTVLPRALNEDVTRTKSVACLHAFARHDQPVSPDLAVFKKIAERIPGVTIEDRTGVLASMRSVKSSAEAKAITAACEASKAGLEELIRSLAPGVKERVLQASLERGFAAGGGVGTGFAPIVGWGVNSCVLHYKTNHNTVGEGGLVLVDSGTTVEGYCSDVTRVFPVSGTFTEREAEIYDLVLKAEKAAIAAVKPGVTLGELDAVARKIIDKAGYGDYFFHSIGHHLGLEVHDANPNEPLKAGAVVTIEPGVYLQDERIGVRIEDDIRVTATGHENLSRSIPKDRAEVEAWMKKVRG